LVSEGLLILLEFEFPLSFQTVFLAPNKLIGFSLVFTESASCFVFKRGFILLNLKFELISSSTSVLGGFLLKLVERLLVFALLLLL
jgi:hypothetical protein